MKNKGFDVIAQKWTDGVTASAESLSTKDALDLNTAGQTISTVSGTAIPGTRTSGTRFTRTSGVWIDYVVIPISAIVAAGVYDNFVVGETVTETGSSSTGVVQDVTTTKLVLKTITKAFAGSATLTGGTSGVTATGGTAVNVLTPLKGKLAWSHTDGTLTAGNWVRILDVATTGAYFNTIATDALHSTGTSVVISHEGFPATADEHVFAREQMTLVEGS